jgi:hypothetical protein
MMDPKRLLEEGSALETSLLRVALDDAPRKGLDRRIQVALGIGGIAISASTATSTAAAASKATPYLVSLGIVKWAGVAVIGASAVVGTAAVIHREAAHAPTTTSSMHAAKRAPTRTLAPAATQSMEVRSKPAAPPEESLALVPAPPATATEPPGNPTKPAFEPRVLPVAQAPITTSIHAPAPQAKSALTSEVKLLDDAHAALDSGDTRLAMTLLDRHDREFRHGTMTQESLHLRIEVYAVLHDDARVNALGRAFVSRYSDSPLAPRVRSLMGGEGQ